jgi:hypothetical protein
MERSALIDAKRAVVTQQLKDPSSTQFRNEHLTNGVLCGELNSKNGFGAYVGYKRFVAQDGAYAQLEGYAPVGAETTTVDGRIAELDDQIQFMRDNRRERTAEETHSRQFEAKWNKHCT